MTNQSTYRTLIRGQRQLQWIFLVWMTPFCIAYGQEPHATRADTSLVMSLDSSEVRQIQISPAAEEVDLRPRLFDMVTNVPGDWVRSASIAVDSRSLPYIGGIAATTGVLMVTDGTTNAFARRINRTSLAVHSTSRQFVRLGDGKTHLAIAGAFAAYGFVADDNRALSTASETVEALIACGISVQALKHVTGRESPGAATSSRGVWRVFPSLGTYQRHQAKYYAFPSGHIATTMSTLTIIAENYPEATWIRPIGYSLMGCVGLSLMNVGYHWSSDLPLGIAMGYVFGMVAAHRQDHVLAFSGNDQYAWLRILPSVSREGTGVTVTLLF